MTTVEIVEVSPRDGLQNEEVLLSTAAKIGLIERAIDAGARRIEATSFVHPRLVPQMADAEEVMDGVPRSSAVSYIGLALNRRGVDRALAADCDEINYVVAASETFAQRNQGASITDALAGFAASVDEIHAAGRQASVTISTAFGCPFEGEVAVSSLVEVARRAAEAGADEVAIADTIGVAVPTDVQERVTAVREVLGDAALRVHFHDTRHTGVANVWAAVEASVSVIDASLAGVGGCPFAPNATGNVATEDVLYLLERAGVEHGWDLARVVAAVPWIEGQLGKPAAGMVARAGLFPPVS